MTPTTVETPREVKARGAFYTPAELTRFLARWAVRSGDDRVLEPSCGDGAFVTAIAERFAALGADDLAGRLVGVEREPDEALKALALAPTADVLTSDFFDVDPASLPPMDAAIGNPPYIRYHEFTGADREKGLSRARAQGVELTRLASSWAHFVVHSVAFSDRPVASRWCCPRSCFTRTTASRSAICSCAVSGRSSSWHSTGACSATRRSMPCCSSR